MAVHLSIDALNWSLKHHLRYGDTDLFPKAFEFQVAERNWEQLSRQLVRRNLEAYSWRPGRSMLVMKDGVSFRRATQFDPIDSIQFAALIWMIGPEIEGRRPPRDANKVLSYRFEPSTSGQLYAPGKVKRAFWTRTMQLCKDIEQPWVVTTDITDFYSQIRHSHLEEQLQATVGPQMVSIVMKALRAVQGNLEIGVPVGPHTAHLLAELSLLRFDEFMVESGFSHVRFADDIHIACRCQSDAREALYAVANYMHGNLQLSLSRHKTRVLDLEKVEQYARTAIGDSETADDQSVRDLIEHLILENTSMGDDEGEDFEDLDESEQEALSSESLRELLEEQLEDEAQVALRQTLRSLSHLRAPGAIEFVIEQLEKMLPAMSEAVEYLSSALIHFEGDRRWMLVRMLAALDLPIVRTSAHMQTLLLSLLVQFPESVDFSRVVPRYSRVEPAARREILLLAGEAGHAAWLSSQIPGIVDGGDEWLIRALVEASRCMSVPERNKLKNTLKARHGARGLLDDPARHDRKKRAEPRLARASLKSASGQDAFLSFAAVPDEGRCREFARRYGGELSEIDGDTGVFRGLETEALLADAEAGHLDGGMGLPGVLQIVLADGECLYERLPEVTFATPALQDIDAVAIKQAVAKADLLLVTTADIEKRAVLSRLAPLPGHAAVLVGSLDNITYRIGRFGRYAAAHVHTTQGAEGRGGATLSVQEALAAGRFKACLLIGIAFGFDRRKQRLGDVLVAESIQPYEHAKVEGDHQAVTPRGALMLCGTVLSERFRNRMDSWSRRRTVTDVKIHQGTVLAGGKLVNSKPFSDLLLKLFRDLRPVGGEMEGHGAYAAASTSKVEIVLVKAICDWADGSKNDRAQQFAADVAADACHHLLSKANILDSLDASDLGPSPAPVVELPDAEMLFRTKAPDTVATVDEFLDDDPFL